MLLFMRCMTSNGICRGFAFKYGKFPLPLRYRTALSVPKVPTMYSNYNSALHLLARLCKHFNLPCFSQIPAFLEPFTGRHFWNRKCRKKTWWQQEFAVLRCEATANSVTGHVCVNSNACL